MLSSDLNGSLLLARALALPLLGRPLAQLLAQVELLLPLLVERLRRHGTQGASGRGHFAKGAGERGDLAREGGRERGRARARVFRRRQRTARTRGCLEMPLGSGLGK